MILNKVIVVKSFVVNDCLKSLGIVLAIALSDLYCSHLHLLIVAVCLPLAHQHV